MPPAMAIELHICNISAKAMYDKWWILPLHSSCCSSVLLSKTNPTVHHCLHSSPLEIPPSRSHRLCFVALPCIFPGKRSPQGFGKPVPLLDVYSADPPCSIMWWFYLCSGFFTLYQHKQRQNTVKYISPDPSDCTSRLYDDRICW